MPDAKELNKVIQDGDMKKSYTPPPPPPLPAVKPQTLPASAPKTTQSPPKK